MTATAPILYSLDQIKHALTEDTFDAIIQAMATGFAQLEQKKVQLGTVIHLGPFSSSSQNIEDACIKSGYVNGQLHMVVKISTGGFRENLKHGLPTADGLMVVFSQKTGRCEAVLCDAGWLTDLRTAAAGALACKLLAPAPSLITTIGVIGTGIQARFQLMMLKRVCHCRTVMLWGRNAVRTEEAKRDMVALGFQVMVATNLESLCLKCRLIITCTSSTSPLLMDRMIQPGTHITAVGADGLGKQELDPILIQRADLVVCDEVQQCITFGECSHTNLTEEFVRSLGAIVQSGRPHRRPEDITIFDSTGVGIQDVQIACMALERCSLLTLSKI